MRSLLNHLILIAGVLFLASPLYLVLVSSSHGSSTLQQLGLQWLPGDQLTNNYLAVFKLASGFSRQVTVVEMLRNSLIVALGSALLTTLFSLLAAYAFVFVRMHAVRTLFWVSLLTLLFPLEARFVNTFQITATLGLINTHTGIVLPTLALALGTLFFRQNFKGLPAEIQEAAQLDSAGPIKFLIDIVIPMYWRCITVVFVIAFILGWNQYLWPLMISTDDSLYTLVRGIRLMGQESGPGMALLVITLLPPLMLLIMCQRWFAKVLE